MIRVVSFDLWFTLIWEKHPDDEELYSRMRVESIFKILRSRGYDVSLGRIREIYMGLGAARMVMNGREIASMILIGLGLKNRGELIDEIAEVYEMSTSEFRPRENPEARHVLSTLKRMGMRIAIVSNTSFSGRGVKALLRNVGIDNYVDVVISSSDVGFAKPQRMIFQRLVTSIGIEPTEVVHVGDACVEDVMGALASNIHAVYYTGLLHLRGAKPNVLCLDLVPTIKSLGEFLDLLKIIE
ncbi:MAG: HAD family hydrolase [Ignisphaera sp.]